MGNNKNRSYYPILFLLGSLISLYCIYTMQRDCSELVDINHKQWLMLEESNSLIRFILDDSTNTDIKTHIRIREIISYDKAILDGLIIKDEE